MSDPNYDMLDMEETDYKTEFNLMWRQWVDCKEERNELYQTLQLLKAALRKVQDEMFEARSYEGCECSECMAWRKVERLLD